MKNDILEHIIKNVLFEQTTKEKTKEERTPSLKLVKLSDKEYNKATAAGAVGVYGIKVKGKINPNNIAFNLSAISSVDPYYGQFSKLANEKFIYIYSDPIPGKLKQIIKVWIMPVPNPPFKVQFDDGSLNATITIHTGISHIGSSNNFKDDAVFLSKKAYDKLAPLQAKFKEQERLRLQDLETQEQEEAERKQKGQEEKNKQQQAYDAELQRRQAWLDKNDTENMTFPYTWHWLSSIPELNFYQPNMKENAELRTSTVYKKNIKIDNVKQDYLFVYDAKDKWWEYAAAPKTPQKFLTLVTKQQANYLNFNQQEFNNYFDKFMEWAPNSPEKKEFDGYLESEKQKGYIK